MIVVVDLHFQVQAGVLGKVSVGIGVFRAEDRSNLIYSSHVTGDAHLFGELWTLGTEGERIDGKCCERTQPEQDKRADESNLL